MLEQVSNKLDEHDQQVQEEEQSNFQPYFIRKEGLQGNEEETLSKRVQCCKTIGTKRRGRRRGEVIIINILAIKFRSLRQRSLLHA